MSLLFVALLGFVVPNGFFLYWLFFEFDGMARVLQDKLALGFMLLYRASPDRGTK